MLLVLRCFLEGKRAGLCRRVARSRRRREQTCCDTDTFSIRWNEDDADIISQQRGKPLMVFACYMSLCFYPAGVMCPQPLLNMCVWVGWDCVCVCVPFYFSHKIQMSVRPIVRKCLKGRFQFEGSFCLFLKFLHFYVTSRRFQTANFKTKNNLKLVSVFLERKT